MSVVVRIQDGVSFSENQLAAGEEGAGLSGQFIGVGPLLPEGVERLVGSLHWPQIHPVVGAVGEDSRHLLRPQLGQNFQGIADGPYFQAGHVVQIKSAVVLGERGVLPEIPALRVQKGAPVGDVIHVVHGIAGEAEVLSLDFREGDEAGALQITKNASSLQFRKFSPHVMGLCLTYLVNCGLSTRKTRDVMREVHGIKISHAQIANYATTAAYCVKPFVDSYDYKPTNYLAADETYTKVKGSRRYVWFIMDAIKKSILGYRSSDSRDTTPCILAMRMAFDKFKKFPGKALKFVADGYTAYKLAQQQFALHGMHFDVTQVIGLTNEDEVSTEYRWLKQIIERLNRTFKFSYKVTNRLWL